MKKILLLVLAAIMLFGAVGCTQTIVIGMVQSDKPRITQPVVSDPDMKAVVDGNTVFAFRLYQSLRAGEDGNIFYSPWSISEALAMTWAGSKTITDQDMAKAMNFTLTQDKLHPAFNNIDLQLKSRGQGAKGKDGEGFRLNIVNAIWGQKDFTFQPAFLDVLAQNYGAGLRIVDFINKTEESRTTINDWVSDQTETRIKDLLPQGSVTTLTRLVLTNAVYFNAAWAKPFVKEATSDGIFTRLNGSTVTVPMMRESETLRYAEGTNYQAVELPYDGNELSMVILLPKAGQFDAFEKALDGATVTGIIGKLGGSYVNLTMPKFEFSSDFSLKAALSALGMSSAFNPLTADFSGMTGKKDLYIQDVVHKAFVAVDEQGTEAAAATGVIVGTTSMPVNQAEMKIDRPFIFMIRDIPTGSIIFIGRVLDPTVK